MFLAMSQYTMDSASSPFSIQTSAASLPTRSANNLIKKTVL